MKMQPLRLPLVRSYKMTREYKVEQSPSGQTIISYEENGVLYSFSDNDPANSDYQAYLDRDKPKAALSTPMVIDDPKS